MTDYMSKSCFSDAKTTRDLITAALYTLYMKAEKRGERLSHLPEDDRLVKILRACLDGTNSNFVLSGPLAGEFWITKGRGCWSSHQSVYLYLRDCVRPETRWLGENEIQSYKIVVDDEGKTFLFSLQVDYDCRGLNSYTGAFSLYDYVWRVRRTKGNGLVAFAEAPLYPLKPVGSGCGDTHDLVVLYDFEAFGGAVRQALAVTPELSGLSAFLEEDMLLLLSYFVSAPVDASVYNFEDRPPEYRGGGGEDDESSNDVPCSSLRAILRVVLVHLCKRNEARKVEGAGDEEVGEGVETGPVLGLGSVAGGPACGDDPDGGVRPLEHLFRTWHEKEQQEDLRRRVPRVPGATRELLRGDPVQTLGRVAVWKRLLHAVSTLEPPKLCRVEEYVPSAGTAVLRELTCVNPGMFVPVDAGVAPPPINLHTVEVHPSTKTSFYQAVYVGAEHEGTARGVVVVSDAVTVEGVVLLPSASVREYLVRGLLLGMHRTVATDASKLAVATYGPVPFNSEHPNAKSMVQRLANTTARLPVLTPWHRVPRAPPSPYSFAFNILKLPPEYASTCRAAVPEMLEECAAVFHLPATDSKIEFFVDEGGSAERRGVEDANDLTGADSCLDPAKGLCRIRFGSREVCTRVSDAVRGLGTRVSETYSPRGSGFWEVYVESSSEDLRETWVACSNEVEMAVLRYAEFILRVFTPYADHEALVLERLVATEQQGERYGRATCWPADLELLRRIVRSRGVEPARHDSLYVRGVACKVGFVSFVLPPELVRDPDTRERVARMGGRLFDASVVTFNCRLPGPSEASDPSILDTEAWDAWRSIVGLSTQGCRLGRLVLWDVSPCSADAKKSALDRVEQLRLQLAVSFRVYDQRLVDRPLLLRGLTVVSLDAGVERVSCYGMRSEFQPWGRVRRLLANYEGLHQSKDAGRVLQHVRDADKSGPRNEEGGDAWGAASCGGDGSGEDSRLTATRLWNNLRKLNETPAATVSASDILTHVHARKVLGLLFNGSPPGDGEGTRDAASEPRSDARVAPVSEEVAEVLEKAVRKKTYELQHPEEVQVPVSSRVDVLAPVAAQVDAKLFTRCVLGLDISEEIDLTLRTCGPNGGPLDLEQARAVAIILHALERRLSGGLPNHTPLRLKLVGKPGVGKSAVLHAVEAHLKRRGFGHGILLKTAPSGKVRAGFPPGVLALERVVVAGSCRPLIV